MKSAGRLFYDTACVRIFPPVGGHRPVGGAEGGVAASTLFDSEWKKKAQAEN